MVFFSLNLACLHGYILNQLEDVSEKGINYIWAWFFGGDLCTFISDTLKQTVSG